jgi:hypothetical protein
MAVGEVVRNGSSVASAGGQNAQDPFDESTSRLRIGAAGTLSPDNGISKGSFTCVVGRLGIFCWHDCPYVRTMIIQIATSGCGPQATQVTPTACRSIQGPAKSASFSERAQSTARKHRVPFMINLLEGESIRA